MRLPCLLPCALACTLVITPVLAQTPAGPAAADWEGAVGLIAHHSPNYLGASASRWHLNPGLFLRFGRFSITTSGGFVTRRNDLVERGLTAELIQRDDFLLSLSARFDGGRDAGSDTALTGLPDLRPTVRARLSAVVNLSPAWRWSAAVSPDLLGRGGGVLVDTGLTYEWPLAPRLKAQIGLGTTWADRAYAQSYFGITPAQSQASGHAAYSARAGLRDVSANAGLRIDLGPRWIGFAGVSARALQGPSLASPLVQQRSDWSANGGLAWRF